MSARTKLAAAQEQIKNLQDSLAQERAEVKYLQAVAEQEKVEAKRKADTAKSLHAVSHGLGGYAGGGITFTAPDLSPRVKKLETLLSDILTLEPHLKHYRTEPTVTSPWGSNADWDYDRVHRAAEHLRSIDALESVGYTDAAPLPDNVTPLFPPDRDCCA